MVNRLVEAKMNKADEFYTSYADIEKEIVLYDRSVFDGKAVYCNCDEPWSSFFLFFMNNFKKLNLKLLIATSISGNASYYDGDKKYVTRLYDGSFNSVSCLDILRKADIVVTNPPFSMFREYINTLFANDKQFIVMGNMNAITTKDIFPLIMDGKMWYGGSIKSGNRKFYVPDDYGFKAYGCGIDLFGRYIKVKGVRWFTNVDYATRHAPLNLTVKYSGQFPLMDNYNAINIDNTRDIPADYYDVMGVPISWLDKYCPSQFEILGMSASWDTGINAIRTSTTDRHCPVVNGKNIYRRIFIRRKHDSISQGFQRGHCHVSNEVWRYA